MPVKVIPSYDNAGFAEVADMFYSNFCPDDWDYIIIGDDKIHVDDLAESLYVFEYDIKIVDDMWVAVTYHS